ncbi:MAG: hypothetical protein KBD46_00555 [Candidatus Levybacteria bacterium]|nr:hypothetical protein [Candidatus Levybacteria bacterium]
MKYLKKQLPKFWAFTVGGIPIEPPGSVSHLTPDKVGFLGGNIIQLFINLLLLSATILTLFFLIWGGIDWIMSGGDKEGLAKAKAKITYAIIGLIIAVLSFAIINIIGTFFAVDLFQK